ncbi:MAG: hypothetical protein HON94_14350 [Methylococcales bacterium]|jgi:hypothetical protein|nr:hypothetical protein [Methylococcales bacterium]MBT7408168.1 hypothetical protein [Methylococcales bacterium]
MKEKMLIYIASLLMILSLNVNAFFMDMWTSVWEPFYQDHVVLYPPYGQVATYPPLRQLAK